MPRPSVVRSCNARLSFGRIGGRRRHARAVAAICATLANCGGKAVPQAVRIARLCDPLVYHAWPPLLFATAVYP
jgi:hypothetical protein